MPCPITGDAEKIATYMRPTKSQEDLAGFDLCHRLVAAVAIHDQGAVLDPLIIGLRDPRLSRRVEDEDHG